MLLKLENIIVAILRHNTSSMHHVCVFVGCLASGAESIILSAGGTEGMMVSACTDKSMLLSAPESMILSVCTESMIVSAPPAESMILSGKIDLVIMLTVARRVATTKQQSAILTIADLRLLMVNSASKVAPIGLLPKIAKFCHNFNRLLVEHQRCRALWQLLSFLLVIW
jgi:hypothetical protein